MLVFRYCCPWSCRFVIGNFGLQSSLHLRAIHTAYTMAVTMTFVDIVVVAAAAVVVVAVAVVALTMAACVESAAEHLSGVHQVMEPSLSMDSMRQMNAVMATVSDN